jgi:DNA-binding NarL/FixJ family response regulator
MHLCAFHDTNNQFRTREHLEAEAAGSHRSRSPNRQKKSKAGMTETPAQRTVLIAEDHTLVRQGLRSLLSHHQNLGVIGEASDGLEAVRLTRSLKPDLVLLDLSMPKLSGLDAIQEIKSAHEGVRILVVTVHSNEEYVLSALKAGAHGYILKRASHEELLLAVNSVLEGQSYLSPEVSGRVIQGYLSTDPSSKSILDRLTQREREVFKLVAEGHTNKQAAELLFVSVKTVEKHRGNLMRKLELRDAYELRRLARREGLIEEE